MSRVTFSHAFSGYISVNILIGLASYLALLLILSICTFSPCFKLLVYIVIDKGSVMTAEVTWQHLLGIG